MPKNNNSKYMFLPTFFQKVKSKIELKLHTLLYNNYKNVR
jgi:hypothetical protein